jgi:hypothetical protein
MDVGSLRLCNRRFKSGGKNVGDRPCGGRPAKTATMKTEDKVDPLIRDGRRIISELCAAIAIGKLAVMAIII